MPPAAKFTTGSLPFCATYTTKSYGASFSFANVISSSEGIFCKRRIAAIMVLICLTASTTFPVPASPLVRIMQAPSPILLNASPMLRAPHTNGVLNSNLFKWYISSAGVSTSLSSI